VAHSPYDTKDPFRQIEIEQQGLRLATSYPRSAPSGHLINESLSPIDRFDFDRCPICAIVPKSIFGWLAVTTRVLGRRRGHRIVQHWQGRTVIISAKVPQHAQLDGDSLGEVNGLRMRIDPGPC
jgi:hypothetical protein